MGMIKSIRLENFQSHKDTKIIFHKGLTVILGQTDQGKSSIIRALKWVLYNEPRGTDFIKIGSKKCRVTLEMKDGSIIKRERDGNRNRYILIKNGNKQIFEGFGNKVPLEITRAHGIPKVQIDTDATSIVNIAEQLEAPFLISESGGNRAKALGRLVGIHVMDAALRITNKDLNDAEQKHKIITKDISGLTEELQKYKDLEKLEGQITLLKDYIKKLKQSLSYLAKLQNIKLKLEPLVSEIRECKTILNKLNFVESIQEYVILMDQQYYIYKNLARLKDQYNHVQHSINIECNIIKNTKNLLEIEEIYSVATKLSEKLVKLKNIQHSIAENEKGLKDIRFILESTKNVFLSEKLLLDAEKLLKNIKAYLSINDQLKLINRTFETQYMEIKKFERTDLAERYLQLLSEKISKMILMQNLKNSMMDVKSSIKKGEKYLQEITAKLNIMAKQYGKLLMDFSICPTCLNPIDEETTKKITSEILC